MTEDYALYSGILDNPQWILHDIHTPLGTILQVFLGNGSIYLILDEHVDAVAFYPFIRESLRAVRVFLYLPGKGQYDPNTRTFQPFPDDERLVQEIEHCLSLSPSCYSQIDLQRFRARLVQLNAQSRGYHKAEDGTMYVLRNGVFHKASPLDTQHILVLCLYGGFWGFHRFALGKWFTGLLYSLTCGFFLIVWLMDLLELFFGFMYDSRKRLLFPLKDIGAALKKLPVSLLLGILILAGYVSLLMLLLRNADELFTLLQHFS